MITTCPACASRRCGRRIVKNDLAIHACRACGTWFVADPPPSASLREIYREGYFTESLAQHADASTEAAAWRATRANARRRLRTLRRFAPHATHLLDVGCGTGGFLSVAREAYACEGIDISDEAVGIVRDKLGVPARSGDLLAMDLPEGAYDIVTLFDVIEHVPRPREMVQRVGKLLSTNGIVMLTTGDVDSLAFRVSPSHWHLMTPPEHLTFFSRTGIVRLIERAGLRVERVAHEPVGANVGYMADKIAQTVGGPARGLPMLMRLARLDRLDLDVNLLDVVTVVARRV